MVNRNRCNWSAMGSSQFEFVNDLDERVKLREVIYQQEKQLIYETITGILKKDAVKMDETFSTILQVLREIKEEYNL